MPGATGRPLSDVRFHVNSVPPEFRLREATLWPIELEMRIIASVSKGESKVIFAHVLAGNGESLTLFESVGYCSIETPDTIFNNPKS